MISYEGFQDTLNALIVIFVVSVIIAVAWLSTNVREQPLIATAVVVFQSDVSGDRDRNTSVSATSERENQNGGTQEGEATSVQSAPSVIENENSHISKSTVMEVNQKVEELPSNCKMADSTSVDSSVSKKTEEVVEEKESSIATEAAVLDKDTHDNDKVQSCSPNSCVVKDEPAEVCEESFSPNPSELRNRDESQEMEVRNRRLQHFVSMGGSPVTVVSHEKNTTQDTGLSVDGISNQNVVTQKVEPVRDSTSNRPLAEENEERPPGSIRIRLKFLDETQRFVFAQPTEQVGNFKRQHFSIEMDANRRIRLIFNGQLLSQDSSTLAQYGLFDNCVVHCHVSQPQQIGQTNSQMRDLTTQDDEDAYVSCLLAPLLYCVMVVMWYLRYEYSHLFNMMSTVILLFLTALLIISTYLLYMTQNVPGSDAQISSRHEIDANSLL